MAADERICRAIIVLRNGLTQIVEELNQILGDMAPPETRSALGIPKIDLADLATAGWTTYHTKQPAEVSEAAWIKNPAYFTDFEAPPVVLELVKALNKTEKKTLRLGDMDYFFSGEGKFLSRRPAKKEKAG